MTNGIDGEGGLEGKGDYGALSSMSRSSSRSRLHLLPLFYILCQDRRGGRG